MREPPLIGVVGVCTSGKSTLIRLLTPLGYQCRHIAQEHSYVPDMWQRLCDPDLLVYLEVTFERSMQRKRMNWNQADYEEQLHRLRHAREHADIVVDTSALTPEDLVEQIRLLIEAAISESNKPRPAA